MTAVLDSTIRFWHFRCPECGMGDQEFGQLAEAHDIHCEVCLEDQGRTVVLRRWPAHQTVPSDSQASSAAGVTPAERTRLAG
jgi:hypothetical protein